MAGTTGGTTPNYSSFGYGMLAAQAVSGVINAIGAYSITKHNNATARAMANIARINAQTMELQAQGALRAGEKAIVQKTMAAGQYKAKQKVQQASSGFVMGKGSNVDSLATTDLIKEIDSNQIKANATRQAWGYRMQATGYEGQALMAEASVQSAGLAAGVSLLSGASQVANSYALMDNEGMFNGTKNQKKNIQVDGLSSASPMLSGYGGQLRGQIF